MHRTRSESQLPLIVVPSYESAGDKEATIVHQVLEIVKVDNLTSACQCEIICPLTNYRHGPSPLTSGSTKSVVNRAEGPTPTVT
jgi:hypothetical protein